MPVVTRSQSRTISELKCTNSGTTEYQTCLAKIRQQIFTAKVNRLQYEYSSAEDNTSKVKIMLEAFKAINNDMPRFVDILFDKIVSIKKFVCSTLLTTYKLDNKYHNGTWNDVDKHSVKMLVETYNETKYFMIDLIKKYHKLLPNDDKVYTDAIQKVREFENNISVKKNSSRK